MWKSAEHVRHDELVETLRHAAHQIATAITQGFKHMADTEAKALADLTSAVSNVGDAIAAEIQALQAALTAQGIDHSPEIEASVTKLNDLTAALKTSLPAPAATPAAATSVG